MIGKNCGRHKYSVPKPPGILDIKDISICKQKDCHHHVPTRQVLFRLKEYEVEKYGNEFLNDYGMPAIYAFMHYEDGELRNAPTFFGPMIWLTTYYEFDKDSKNIPASYEIEDDDDMLCLFYTWPIDHGEKGNLLIPDNYYNCHIEFDVKVFCHDDYHDKKRIIRFNDAFAHRFEGAGVYYDWE